MCGIAGIFGSRAADQDLLSQIGGALAHRGPDDQALWVDTKAGVAMVHRRLAIVDLSPAGNQPMVSANGRFVLCFNGEIYNHSEIRQQLEESGCARPGGWRGHSDTETLLEAIAHWGLARALERAVGMFALALWDRKERKLSLVRDRFGEKPLYYGWVGTDFVFASELKAIRAHPGFDCAIDRKALSLYASRTYIPAPYSIYKRVYKLPPGCVLTVPLQASAVPLDEPPREDSRGPLRLERYWSYREVLRSGLADPIEREVEALGELDSALARAVAGQSIADVPVGMFLSGGIDSSTIAALYQRNSSRPVRTFSIGFDNPRYNEAPFARRIAEYLGTVHHEQIVTEQDAMRVIPELPAIYDEPFADSSQIPTFLVSRMARSDVTVALTGDGGDELFGGYYRHFYAPRMWRRISRVPAPLRAIGAPLSRIPTRFWQGAGALLRVHGSAQVGRKIQKGLRVAASARTIDDVYASFLDEWSFAQPPVLHSASSSGRWDLELGGDAPDEARIMYCDAVSYLPDDILCKVDRAAMAVSLETRVPFLDHRVAAVAARIPTDMKIAGGEGKRIIRELLYRQVPRELLERPKAGFAVPVGDWLKGALRPWAESLLDEARLKSEGWFAVEAVRRRWNDHLNGRRDSTAAIWAILMFQAWLDEQRSPALAAA